MSRLRREFDSRVRGTIADRLTSGWTASADGPVLRVRTQGRGLIFTTGLADESATSVHDYALRARDYFADLGESVEWKTYGHDNATLVPTLRQLDFEPEPAETVLLAPVSVLLLDQSAPPPEIRIRQVSQRADLERIATFEGEVWGEDWSWLAEDLDARVAAAPEEISILVAESEDRIVSAAWLVVLPRTGVAGLWGGSTDERWRGRGIYRALVSERARIAAHMSIDYLWVDASDGSRPILSRLGMTAVAVTTPWVWSPHRASG